MARSSFRFLLAAALVLAASAAGAADMGKTLHAEFSIAETSFDPAQGWDAASDAVIEHIFRCSSTSTFGGR